MKATTDAVCEFESAGAAERRLVVVMRPIASGKSTLAGAIAQRLRSGGEAVAVVGLDEVAEMALPTLDDWTWAHEVQGQVVAAWLATPIPTVVAEGPATPSEVEQLLRHVPSDVRVFSVLLITSYETALERAAADPGRGISKDPGFLGEMYRQFNEELPGMTCDLRLNSEEATPGTLGATVVAALEKVRVVR